MSQKWCETEGWYNGPPIGNHILWVHWSHDLWRQRSGSLSPNVWGLISRIPTPIGVVNHTLRSLDLMVTWCMTLKVKGNH